MLLIKRDFLFNNSLVQARSKFIIQGIQNHMLLHLNTTNSKSLNVELILSFMSDDRLTRPFKPN